MRVYVALVALLAAVPAVQAGDWLERGVVASSVADLASTEFGLRRCSGCYESNPVMGGSLGSRVALKTLGTAVVIAGARKLEPKHPKWSKGLKIGMIVVFSGATVNNLHRARR